MTTAPVQTTVPFFRLELTDDEVAAVTEVLRSG